MKLPKLCVKQYTFPGSAVFSPVSKVNRILLGCSMITTLSDWFKQQCHLVCPMTSKTKTNRDLLAHVFPRFVSVAVFSLCFDWFTGLTVFLAL